MGLTRGSGPPVSALCVMGVTRAHAQSRAPGSFSSSSSLTAQGGGHHPSPNCTGGEAGSPRERQALACGHAPGQRWCWSPPAVPHRPPTSLTTAGMGRKSQAAGGRQSWRRWSGGTPTGSGIVPRLRFKKHRMPSSPPDNCRPLRWQPLTGLTPLLGGTGSKVRAKDPAPHPGPPGQS